MRFAPGSPSIIVAIIDSGVDLNHPDLLANLWVNKGEIPGNGIDDDGNGERDEGHCQRQPCPRFSEIPGNGIDDNELITRPLQPSGAGSRLHAIRFEF